MKRTEEEKIAAAAEAHERKLELNRLWYQRNRDRVRLANGGSPVGRPAPKGAGRPTGSLNKRTLHARVVLEDLGANPAEFLARSMKDESNPLDVRIDCAKSLMPYVFPKLSAVEVSGPDGDPIKVAHEDQLLKRMMENPALVQSIEDALIEQAENERRERELPPDYAVDLPS